jgi:cell division protein FtsB
MSEFSPLEALKFVLEWARANHITPLNTFISACGVVGLFFFSRFVRSAKKVVTDVHNVYAQALEDEKKLGARLRERNESLEHQRHLLVDELEAERRIKEDLLRTLARMRALTAKRGED